MKNGFSRALILVLLICLAATSVFADSGQGKPQTNRSIAIVFDNSGSMYIHQNMAWCRATYATEVFASMMNRGDTLTIYPMHPVEIDGKSYSSERPITLSGPKDAEQIRKMYTPDAQGTPIETIDEAHRGLKGAPGEQWLIVLTDGDTFYENDVDLKGETAGKLQERLMNYSNDVNILYLGIGAGAVIPQVSGGKYKYYADKAGDSSEVLAKLTSMCNMIFGRDTMEIKGQQFSMDVSMKKLIFFIQGKNISDVRATASDGSEIGKKTETHVTRYSELGAGGPNTGKTFDANLQGMIVTYETCKAGSYQLGYSGDVSSAVAYYEPDVDLVVNFLDENGTIVDPNRDNLTAGDYTLQYGLWDTQLNQWSESDLLGKTHYTVDYTIDGSPNQVSTDERRGTAPISLAADQELDATISADYLSGYHLEKPGFAMGFPLKIKPWVFDVKDFTIDLSGGAAEYPLSELESLGQYTLTAAYQGKALKAGSGPDSFVPVLDLGDCNIQTECEPLSDNSGYSVRLKYNGDALHTDVGSFVLRYGVAYTNEHGETGDSSRYEAPFTVINDAYLLRLTLEAEQRYYQTSELDVGAPILVHLTKEGEPLTDEEMSALTFEIDTEGIPFTQQLLNGQSALELRLKNEGEIRSGSHRISAKASGTDSVGNEISGEDSLRVEVQPYPLWMRWLIIGLILLLLLLLLLLILNQKILPKKVLRGGDTDFNIGGKTIEDNAKLAYNRKGKSLEITAPSAPAYPYVSCAAKLKLEPVSPRRIRSARRQMAVTEVRASSDISSVEVGAAVYELDKATGKFVKEPNTPTIISNNSVITVSGTAQTGNGRNKAAICSQQLRFK